jgi:hypothetical protein
MLKLTDARTLNLTQFHLNIRILQFNNILLFLYDGMSTVNYVALLQVKKKNLSKVPRLCHATQTYI